MNPIGLLALAVSSGCGAALVWLLYGSCVAAQTQAVVSPPTPKPESANELDTAADRDTWDGEDAQTLREWNKEFADIRAERDTLRNIRLASLGVDAEQPEEVAAR